MMRMFLHPSTHPPYTGDSVFIGPGTSPPTDAYICSSSHAYLLVGGLVPGSSWGSCWGVGWLQLGAIQSPHLTIPEVLFPTSTCTYFLPALAHRPSAFYQQMMLLHSTQQIFLYSRNKVFWFDALMLLCVIRRFSSKNVSNLCPWVLQGLLKMDVQILQTPASCL